MPTVPGNAFAPTVEQRPLETPLERAPDAGLLTSGARRAEQEAAQIGRLGGELGQLADVVIQRERVVQERADATAVFNAETAMKNGFLKIEADVRARRGVAAQGATDDVTKWFDTARMEYAKGLANPRQQELFTRSIETSRLAALSNVSRHEAVETQRAFEQAYEATVQSSIDVAAASPTDAGALANARDTILKRIEVRAGIEGMAPEAQALLKGQALTKMHEQVIQALAQADPMAAANYFEANKNDIVGSARDKLGQVATNATRAARVDAVAADTWARMGPSGDTAPIELDKIESSVREQLKADPEAAKLAIGAIRERAHAAQTARRERDTARSAAVLGAFLEGTSLTQIQRMPDFLALGGDERSKLVTFITGQLYQREQRALTAEQRASVAEERRDRLRYKQNFGAYLVYSDPNNLAQMSRNEIMTLMPEIGPDATRDLLSKHEQLNRAPKNLADARIDRELINAIGNDLGLPTFKSPAQRSKVDNERIGLLTKRAEDAIALEQQRTKREMSRDERESFLRKRLAEDVVEVGNPYTLWFTSRTMPAALVRRDDIAYVIVEGRQVFLDNIPALDRRQIQQALRSRGLPVTEQSIAEMFLRGNRKD
jgi:hypothetical protein